MKNQPALHGRDHLEGGSDPIPFDFPAAAQIGSPWIRISYGSQTVAAGAGWQDLAWDPDTDFLNIYDPSFIDNVTPDPVPGDPGDIYDSYFWDWDVAELTLKTEGLHLMGLWVQWGPASADYTYDRACRITRADAGSDFVGQHAGSRDTALLAADALAITGETNHFFVTQHIAWLLNSTSAEHTFKVQYFHNEASNPSVVAVFSVVRFTRHGGISAGGT